MMSSLDRNFNYKYTVSKDSIDSDLSATTYQRRLLKKQQSHSAQFITDLTEITPQKLLTNPYLIDQIQGPVYISSNHSVLNNRKNYIQIKNKSDFDSMDKTKNVTYVFFPSQQTDADELSEIYTHNKNLDIQWNFKNYDINIKKSLTIVEIANILKKINLKKSDIPFWNTNIPNHFELEYLATPNWSLSTSTQNILVSIIIPTYNNCLFLCNTIQHLISQSISPENYEIIIVDDGSTDHSEKTLFSLVQSFKKKINMKYIYWPKINANGSQKFFRAGLARNTAVGHSSGQQLFFLDSDMLVHYDFIKDILIHFENFDVLQFSRLHIQQKESFKNPRHHQIQQKNQTYIEDEKYWNQLFNSDDWSQLQYYWKYTCTYALGLSKCDFYDIGRFKRHFISYGFEDTDIGFRLYKKNKKFKLIQKPLLHLTNYSSMQYQNSKFIRDQLLRKTSKLLFLDNLDLEIFEAFKFYYQFEKPFWRKLTEFLD